MIIAPNVGDLVHIKAIVTQVLTSGEVRVMLCSSTDHVTAGAFDIVRIETRALAVGDTVRNSRTGWAVRGTILAIHEDVAWCHLANGNRSEPRLADLVRVP